MHLDSHLDLASSTMVLFIKAFKRGFNWTAPKYTVVTSVCYRRHTLADLSAFQFSPHVDKTHDVQFALMVFFRLLS